MERNPIERGRKPGTDPRDGKEGRWPKKGGQVPAGVPPSTRWGTHVWVTKSKEKKRKSLHIIVADRPGKTPKKKGVIAGVRGRGSSKVRQGKESEGEQGRPGKWKGSLMSFGNGGGGGLGGFHEAPSISNTTKKKVLVTRKSKEK